MDPHSPILVRIALLLVSVAMFANAETTNPPYSNFDLGAEDWTVGNLFSPVHGSVPEFVTFGGNPGGFIQTVDIYGFNAFRAPANWLGNQSSRYGEDFRFSLRAEAVDIVQYPMLVLASGFTWLQYRTPAPGTNWTNYVIHFSAAENWEIADGSGNPGVRATEAQFRSVLANLDWFAINADWHTGDDLIGLDSAYFMSPNPTILESPEISSVFMAAAGLATLVAASRFRRR